MAHKIIYWDDIKEGQCLPSLTKEITATTIIAGAFATRDFHPLHHDRDFAQKQGVTDIFMSMPVIGGWAIKFLTDWTGPEGEPKRIDFRIEAPCFPGDLVKWNGKVIKKYIEGNEHLIEVDYIVTIPRGTHCSGKATLALPTKNLCD